MPTAIVVGATGILGQAILRALIASPGWTKIYALSRSQLPSQPSDKVHHSKIDLTSSKGDITNQFRIDDVNGQYLFYAAYLPRRDEAEANEVNSGMLRNVLDALESSGASKSLKRVILTTGAKQYGVHLGPVKNPMEESDPWIESTGRPPNFYYTQQRILSSASKKSGHWDWVVTYPNDVIGIARGNTMNLSTSLAIYCAISAELGSTPEEKILDFPGNEYFYTCFDTFTSANLHAEFNLWVAQCSNCSNQAFNVVNGDAETWVNMWPKLAKRFGCTVPERMFERRIDDADKIIIESPSVPPFEDMAAERGMVGRMPKSKIEVRINLIKWSQKPEVKAAWDRIVERTGVEKDGLEKATWMFLGIILGRRSNFVLSMSKARKFGWTGYKDTWEALEETFDELDAERIVPTKFTSA